MISNSMMTIFQMADGDDAPPVVIEPAAIVEPEPEAIVEPAQQPIKYIRPGDLANTPQPYRRGPLFRQTMEDRIKQKLGLR